VSSSGNIPSHPGSERRQTDKASKPSWNADLCGTRHVSTSYRRGLLASSDWAKGPTRSQIHRSTASCLRRNWKAKSQTKGRDSQAVEDYWHRPITAEQSQVQMESWRKLCVTAASGRTNLDLLMRAVPKNDEVQELRSLSQDRGERCVDCCAWIFLTKELDESSCSD
jgi:hypothetical protein